MTSLVRLSETQARTLTEEIKGRAEELWGRLLEAYEGGAHLALGYSSWGEYFEAELGGDKSRAYQLIDAGRVVQAIEDHSTIVERPTEGQARALRSVVKESPEEAAELWGDVVEESNHMGQPVTAAAVKEKVEERKAPPPPWSNDELRLREVLEAGKSVVVNMAKDGHPNLVAWAKQRGIFVRVDRASKWGNPFELGKDGGRETVVDNYEDCYLPHKPSLLNSLGELRGKALGCWCAPKLCHGHVLRERAMGEERICRA